MPDGRLHLELDTLSEFLVDEAGRRLTIQVDEPLKPANHRLMDFLGVTVEVRPVSDAPVDHVRRPQGKRGRTMGHYDAGYELPAGEAGKPDWIDFRASVGRAERRVEAGEVVSRCWSCKTELDVPAPVHSPRCRTLGRSSDDGRAALDAMDRLETQRELLGVDDQEEDGDDAASDEVPKPEEEVETVRGGVVKWSRERIIEAIQAFHAEHGRPPKADEWIKSAPEHPTQSTVNTHFGSWANGIEAAGYDRPKRGGTGNTNRSSVREPKAREAAVSPPPADVKQPAPTGDAAVVRESPSPAVGTEEAGSRTDEQPEGGYPRDSQRIATGDQADGHHEWLLSLGLNAEILTDEIARLDELSVLCAQRRDALQRFLDDLEPA